MFQLRGTQTFEELISSITVNLNIQEVSSKVSKCRQEDYSKTDYYIIKTTVKNVIPS